MSARVRVGRDRSNSTKSNLGLRHLLSPVARPERGRLVLISITSILGGFAEAGMLLIIARTAFGLASNSDEVSISLPIVGKQSVAMSTLLVAAAVLVIVRMALQWAAARAAARVSADVMLRERRTLIRLLLNASWDLQSGLREGRAQELVSGYVSGTAGALQGLSQFLTGSFNLVAMLIAALAVNAVASLVAAVSALMIGLMLRPLRAAVRRTVAQRADANLELATTVTEFTAALQEVRIFGVAPSVSSRVDGLASTVSNEDLRAAYTTAVIPVLYQGVAMLLIVGALAVVYGAGLAGLASLGAVVLIMIRSLSYAQSVQASIQGMHAAAPYVEMLESEKARFLAAALPEGGQPIDHLDVIQFEDVSFDYEPGVPVLRHISFTTRPGEIIGIIGPSGAGKSTLVQILLRLRDPSTGTIRAGGHDVHELSLDDWYERMTFVPQDAHLFAGTVDDNIRFFRDDIDQGEIERAAKLAHIHDDIVDWPRAYDTPVGERGGQLSGGQRQRLCIARALVGDPDVVVLDEPTSALDVKSEALMRETLESLVPSKTVFVVAHRLSTLAVCDRIMVIMRGELQGFDTPEMLEAANPFYREALELSGMR